MQTRREMLGKTLGFFLATRLPFKIEEPIFNPIKKPIECLDLDILKQYSLLLDTTFGPIKGPPLFRVISSPGRLFFECSELEIKEPIIATGYILLNEKKNLVSSKSFLRQVPMLPLDILKGGYEINS